MIIFLGGFLGSGRGKLARKYAEKYGYFFSSIAALPVHSNRRKGDDLWLQRATTPSADAIQFSMYRRVVESLPLVSKMYPNMVVEDEFLRSEPREYFFNIAQQYFDRACFVWVHANETDRELRFNLMVEKGLVDDLDEARRRRSLQEKIFQPFEGTSITPYFFKNTFPSRPEMLREVLLALL